MDVVKAVFEKIMLVWYIFLRYFCVCWAWARKAVGIRMQKMKQGGMEKKIAEAYFELGEAVFTLYQEGQQNIIDATPVQEQLMEIQQLLGKKNMSDERVNEIEREYQEKIEKIKRKYEKRRGIEPVEEQEVTEEAE